MNRFEEQMKEIAENVTEQANDIFQNIKFADIIKGALILISIATRNDNGTE